MLSVIQVYVVSHISERSQSYISYDFCLPVYVVSHISFDFYLPVYVVSQLCFDFACKCMLTVI